MTKALRGPAVRLCPESDTALADGLGRVANFIDADGHVAEAYSPAWNALNLFGCPSLMPSPASPPSPARPVCRSPAGRQIDLSLPPAGAGLRVQGHP
jgi:hypothetical protein